MTADRKPDQLPTTSTGEPVAALAPGPIPVVSEREQGQGQEAEEDEEDGEGEGEASGVLSEGQPVFIPDVEQGHGQQEEMEIDGSA